MAEAQATLMRVGQIVFVKHGLDRQLCDLRGGLRGVCYETWGQRLGNGDFRATSYGVIFENGQAETFSPDDWNDPAKLLRITDTVDETLAAYWTPDEKILEWDWKRGFFDQAFAMDVKGAPVSIKAVPKRRITAG